MAGLGFVAGTLGIGLGNPGQPHVLNRFMALRDPAEMPRAQWIALSWGFCLYAGMLVLGLSARALFEPAKVADSEGVFFLVAREYLPLALTALMTAATLSAILSTADSQLLACASSITRDWPRQPRSHGALRQSRYVVLLISLLALALTLLLPQTILARVLFAWAALGAAFGPPVILLLAGRPVAAHWLAGSMLVGAGTTALANGLLPAPGQWIERLLPFLLSLGIGLIGSRGTR